MKEDTTTGASESRSKVFGILLVHGIGNQRRGETLVAWGEAIVAWLNRWFSGGRRHGLEKIKVELTNTVIDQPGSMPESSIGFRGRESRSSKSWLVSECWWAETFTPPSFTEIAQWSLVSVPRSIVIHYVPIMRSAMNDLNVALNSRRHTEINKPLLIARGNKDVIRAILSLPIFALLGIVIELLVLILWFFSLIPVQVFQGAVLRIQTSLAAVIGDSFVYLKSPLRQSAITSQIQRDIKTMAEQCDSFVVVAHSQGAAATYRAINLLRWFDTPPANLDAVLSLGAGIRKLHDLDRSRHRPLAWSVLSLGVIFLGFFTLVVTTGIVMQYWPGWLVATAIPLGLLFSLLLLMFAYAFSEGNPPEPKVPWFDYYGSHDLVPGGPLLFSGDGPSDPMVYSTSNPQSRFLSSEEIKSIYGPLSECVTNRQSYLKDHTSYFQAQDDFLSKLLSRIADTADFPLKLTLDSAWMSLAPLRRTWRFGFLKCVQLAFYWAVAALCLRHAQALLELGASLGTQTLIPGSSPQWFLKIAQHPDVSATAQYIGGLLVCAAPLVLLFVATRMTWQAVEKREIKQFFDREIYGGQRITAIIFLFLATLNLLAASILWTTTGGQWLNIQADTGSVLALGTLFALVAYQSLGLFRKIPGQRRHFGLLAVDTALQLRQKNGDPELVAYCERKAREWLGDESSIVDCLAAAHSPDSSSESLESANRRAVLDEAAVRATTALDELVALGLDPVGLRYQIGEIQREKEKDTGQPG